MNTVFSFVPPSNPHTRFMLVGEAPGETEFSKQRPFIGKAGKEQKWYLSRFNINPDKVFYQTNVSKEFIYGNPDPTPEQVEYWTPTLLKEIQSIQPKLIVAVGLISTQWFLGNEAELDSCHGLPCHAGEFDSKLHYRAPSDCIILPVYHPAFGFYGDESQQNKAKTLIYWDYSQVAEAIKKIENNEEFEIVIDEYEGTEKYRDVTGEELRERINYYKYSPLMNGLSEIALDTEGVPSDPWSIQVSMTEGIAYVLRCAQPDFQIGIEALQELADDGILFITHCADTPKGCMYDLTMCKVMGLDLTKARIFDTMYALGLLRIEAKGLKPSSYRWCRTKQDDYMGLVEGVAKDRQIEYLINVSAIDWPKPETRLKYDKGIAKLYTPKRIALIAQNILADVWSCKVNKDGDLTNVEGRWYDTDEIQRKQVELELGRFPSASLNDIELDKAIFYAGRDADITLRLKRKIERRLIEMDLIDLFNHDMEILPFLWSMQQNGMPASRSKFEELYAYFDDQCERIISTISNRYFCGRPFNPRSNPQVGVLLRSRGLKSSKRTKTGKQSVGKKSIEHLKYEDDAIKLLFNAKEKLHLRDSFCKKTLDLIPEGIETHDVVSNFNITKVETRRLSTEEPNLLAVPSRTEEGKKIRKSYVAVEGEVFLSCDYSQAESRFMASESNDPKLCKLYTDGRDIHTETAAILIKGIDVKRFERLLLDGDPEAKKLRRDAKDINFGIIYMIQAYGLETQFRMRGITQYSIEHFSDMIKGWYKLYSGVKDYQNRIIARTRRLGYIRDVWGMYRYIPNIWSSDDKLRAEAERQAVSHRIQGGAHGMLRRAMGWLAPIVYSMNDAGLNVKPRLPIHDELLFTCQEEIAEDLMTIVIDALVNHSGIKLRVPIEADGKIAKNWGDCK